MAAILNKSDTARPAGCRSDLPKAQPRHLLTQTFSGFQFTATEVIIQGPVIWSHSALPAFYLLTLDLPRNRIFPKLTFCILSYKVLACEVSSLRGTPTPAFGTLLCPSGCRPNATPPRNFHDAYSQKLSPSLCISVALPYKVIYLYVF